MLQSLGFKYNPLTTKQLQKTDYETQKAKDLYDFD